MINASRTTGMDTKDRTGTPLPPGIKEFVLLAQALSTYGRRLTELLRNPALWRGFTTVARFFGTVDLVEILPRIQRGLMRAAALEALLLRRAQQGRDVIFKERADRVAPPAAPTTKAAPRPKSSTIAQPPLTFGNMPSMEEIEQQVRRRPLGQTVAAICLDLGIAPALCAGPFWNRLFEAMNFCGSSLIAVSKEFSVREKRFEAEDWKRPSLPWPERTAQGIRRALGGFFIGEDLADPFDPAPAAIAGPS